MNCIILNVINNIFTYVNIAPEHYVYYFTCLESKLTIIYNLSGDGRTKSDGRLHVHTPFSFKFYVLKSNGSILYKLCESQNDCESFTLTGHDFFKISLRI